MKQALRFSFMHMILFRVCEWSELMRVTAWTRLSASMLCCLGYVLLGATSASAVESSDQVVWLGDAQAATPNKLVPSSKFAQFMMHSQARVSELEAGVIAGWLPGREFPHTIFAAWDGFEAIGLCTERERVGCKVDLFDYRAGEIRSYHMPLEAARHRSTYEALLSPAQPITTQLSK